MPKGIYARGSYSRAVNNRGKPTAVFWSRVDKNGPLHPVLLTRCWVWTGAKMKGKLAYGQFRGQKCHRFAWRAVGKTIPEGLFVLHRCDNPSCVRPTHLFLGTAQANMDDKAAK